MGHPGAEAIDGLMVTCLMTSRTWLPGRDCYNSSNLLQGVRMGMPVRIDDKLYEQARAHALAERRSISGQVEFWAMVGKAALDNPDLPIDYVRDLLVARAEGKALATPFVPQGRG